MASAAKRKRWEFSEISENIQKATKKKLETFNSIRGKGINIPFWDIIVLTAADEEQQKAYEAQLQSKLTRKELPVDGLKYHVFHDPVGSKIGNGGSTLVSLDRLVKMYGEDQLSKSKILMIHAGGFSQRLPSASVLGKIFTALPLGEPLFQMIEMKLTMYIEFPQRMVPGVFVTCADNIELFVTDGEWSFTKPGVTAMGQPSPVEIGTTHGVFVLSDSKKNLGSEPVCQTTCTKFLHKPSIQTMKDNGVVFQRDGEDYVYTDSNFFLDWKTAKKLLSLFVDIQPLECEICAYGDFLQAMGPAATVDYTKNVANVTNETRSLVRTRERIFHFLKGTELNVLLFQQSRFYHLGTTAEYIHHFCNDPVFRFELNGCSEVMVKTAGSSEVRNSNTTGSFGENNCCLHCNLSTPVSIGEGCVLEYCDIGPNVVIGDHCIISNVHLPEGTEVPPGTFLHTLTVMAVGRGAMFVTVAFGIKDNLKKTSVESELGKLKYFGSPLDVAMDIYKVFQATWTMVNLWHAKLFCIFEKQKDSVLHTVSMIHALKKQDGQALHDCTPYTTKRYSMADILVHKDIAGMLELRNKLREKILN